MPPAVVAGPSKRAYIVEWRNFQAKKNKTWEKCVRGPFVLEHSSAAVACAIAGLVRPVTGSIAHRG